MAYVVLYLGCMFFCYFLGTKQRSRGELFKKPINVVTMTSISLMVLLMGIRMGSSEEIIENLGVIGLQSLFFTIFVMIGGVVAVFITRKLLKIDQFGILKGEQLPETADDEESAQEQTESTSTMIKLILLFVVIGLLVGYFAVRVYVRDLDRFNNKSSLIMTISLCVMMGSIGLDMGIAGNIGTHIKQIGFRVLAFPVAVLIGTALTSAAASLVLPLTLRECLAVGFGFGWYTFAPVSIANAGHVMASAVSFMHNVIRETCGIILIPVLARRLGYIEVCSLPGVSSMDLGLTLVEKSTRSDIIVYSFAIGLTEGLLVPLLVTLSIGA